MAKQLWEGVGSTVGLEQGDGEVDGGGGGQIGGAMVRHVASGYSVDYNPLGYGTVEWPSSYGGCW